MFYTYKATYRRLCKLEEQNYRNTICNDINNNVNKNPKLFWELLNKLDKTNSGQISSHDVHLQEFYQFFLKKLNKADNNHNDFHKSIIDKFHILKEKLHHNHLLESYITTNEIKAALKSLKNGNSSSMDMISNEMLKYGGSVMLKPLEKLFNFILDSGYSQGAGMRAT